MAASPPGFGEIAAKWPAATDEPSYFHLKGFGPSARDYYGLTILRGSPAGPVSVSVARAAEADVLVHSLLREFVFDIGWVIPLLVVVTLVVGVLAIQSAFKPIAEVSRMAAEIGPGATSIRLPDKNLPSEIMPLVGAVNHALDRLEKGFDVQRQFTANAAHELRTPLAIITPRSTPSMKMARSRRSNRTWRALTGSWTSFCALRGSTRLRWILRTGWI